MKQIHYNQTNLYVNRNLINEINIAFIFNFRVTKLIDIFKMKANFKKLYIINLIYQFSNFLVNIIL